MPNSILYQTYQKKLTSVQTVHILTCEVRGIISLTTHLWCYQRRNLQIRYVKIYKKVCLLNLLMSEPTVVPYLFEMYPTPISHRFTDSSSTPATHHTNPIVSIISFLPYSATDSSDKKSMFTSPVFSIILNFLMIIFSLWNISRVMMLGRLKSRQSILLLLFAMI